jgi:uncharacterized protein YbjQ (UPF0145 family)
MKGNDMFFDKVVKKFRLQDQEDAFSKWLIDSGYEVVTVSYPDYDPITVEEIGRKTYVSEIPNAIVEDAVASFEKWYPQHLKETEEREAEEAAKAEADLKQKRQATAGMLITSGFSFEGYNITKYSGYISGDDVVQIDRGSGGWFQTATDVGASLMESLVEIRRNALQELKEAAYALGCNAVIGVDFDYLTMDPETVNANGGTLYMPYVFGVTANGNAVVIEKSKKASQ